MPEWSSDENDVLVKIDHDLCNSAAECVDVCPSEVYVLNDDKKAEALNVESCIQCGACDGACPVDAIWHSVWS